MRAELEHRVEDSSLVLLVADDGQGFDPERTRQTGNGGFGLTGMRERRYRRRLTPATVAAGRAPATNAPAEEETMMHRWYCHWYLPWYLGLSLALAASAALPAQAEDALPRHRLRGAATGLPAAR